MNGTLTEAYNSAERRPHSRSDQWWYFSLVVLILLIAAGYRFWNLSSAPPGISTQELINIQLADRMRSGDISIVYDEAQPAREGLYFAVLAGSSALTGRGLILWRLPSVWMSLLGLAITVSLLRRLFGTRPALLASGLIAVSFWPVWMARSILHVTMMPLVTVFIVYTFARAYLTKDQTNAGMWFTIGGLALGAAQYVHPTAWSLIALLVLFVTYRFAVNQHEVKAQLGNLFYSLSLTVVLCLPLIIFLIRHQVTREPVTIVEQSDITTIPERLLASLAAVALRGDVSPEHNVPGQPIMGPITGVLLVIGIGVALARWRQAQYGLALLWLAAGLLPTALLPHKSDFEFMAVILPILFVFPAIGLTAISDVMHRTLLDRYQQLLASAMTAIAIFMVLITAVRTFQSYFVIWPALHEVQLTYNADLGSLVHYLDTSSDPTPVSICTTPVDRTNDPFALTNREMLAYLMHRRNLPIRYFDCTQSLVIADGGAAQRIIFPEGHYYDHLPGPLLRWMRYATNESVPGIESDVVMRLEVTDEIADMAGSLMTTAPTAWPPESVNPALAALPVSFGHNVSFLGYTVRDDKLRSTDWVELTTYWRLDGPPPPELTVFTHLLGNPVVVIAQDVGLGVEIGTLQPRDIFFQYSMIQTPGRMTSGLYPLSVGLYFPSTGERLQAFENGAARSDRLFLQRIEVTP